MALVEVTDLYMHFGDVKGVDGISFSVDEGAIFGFHGPNSALEDFEKAIGEVPDSATLNEADDARDAAYVTLFGVMRSTLDTQCAA